jgi:hypothetical protein
MRRVPEGLPVTLAEADNGNVDGSNGRGNGDVGNRLSSGGRID